MTRIFTGAVALLLCVSAAAGCNAGRKPQSTGERAYLQVLAENDLDVSAGDALEFLDWFCLNGDDIPEAMRRTNELGVRGTDDAGLMIGAASGACSQ